MTESDPLSAGEYKPLPHEALRILGQVCPPPRLLAHLVLVHDAACRLIDGISAEFPGVEFDPEVVRFGAAVHDIGKIVHPEELRQSGKHLHQGAGVELLVSLGVLPERARFAWTHGNWEGDEIGLEDLIVALADKAWKGKRVDALESRLVDVLSAVTKRPSWECHAKVDELVRELSKDAEGKLAWQASFSG